MKKIALIIDKDNWAFSNTARILQKELAKYYDFTIIPLRYLTGNLAQLFLLVRDYDLIHFLWREPINNFTQPFFEEYTYLLGSTKEQFMHDYVDFNKISTGVYDHLFLNVNYNITEYLFNNISNYYVSSNKLLDIYNNLNIKYKPKAVITDGVDLEKFSPNNLERFNNIADREVIIGWSGNSKWTEEGKDIKGLTTILIPAIEELQQEGYKIKTNFVDSSVKMLPHEEMPTYYNSIDVLVCSSISEGTPNPVLEAMACGVPIISTNVGIVEDALGVKQKKYILEERSIEGMKEKIKKLLENPSDFEMLSKENLKEIKKWSWKEKAKDFKGFFDACLEKEV